MESKSSNNADAETKRLNEEVLENLKPGDLIKIHRDFYNDWAVYIGQEEGVEKVAHWWKGDGTNFRTSAWAKTICRFIKIDRFRKIADSGEAHAKIDSFWTVVGNSKAENGNNLDLENGIIDNSRVVENAKKLANKKEQGKQFYNSEHFANTCRYGDPPQMTSSEGISNVTYKPKLIPDQTSTKDKDDDKIKEHNKQFLDTLEIGDLIKFPRGLYNHWAVYIRNEGDTADAEPKVIHWWGPPDFKTSKRSASLMKTSFWKAAGKSKAEKGNQMDRETGTIDGRRVAARAAAKQELVEEEVLKERYNPFFNNCEHFAKWCRYAMDDDDKVQESPQDHHIVFSEKEDHRTKADSEHSSINPKRTHENLKHEEQLKLIQTEVKKMRESVSTFKDMENRIHLRMFVGMILMIVYVKFYVRYYARLRDS